MKIKTLAGLVGCLASMLLVSAMISNRANAATVSVWGEIVTIEDRLEIFVQQGNSALKGKEYDLAVSRLTTALQINPEKNTASVIYALRAAAYTWKGSLNKAMEDANESIRLNPRYAGGYLRRGVIYLQARNLDKAISEYNTAIQRNPNFAQAYFGRGLIYDYKRQYDQAIRDYDAAIRHDPRDADVYHNRALVYKAICNLDKALADYSEAIRLNPKDASAYYGRAIAHEDIGNFDKASADYEQAIRCVPEGAVGYAIRGNAYFAKGNYKAAASDFAKAAQFSPRDGFVLRVFAWFKATCPEDALRNGKQALQMSIKACQVTNWKAPGWIDMLATAYAEVGDFDQAVKYEVQAMEMKEVCAYARGAMQKRLTLYREHKPYRDVPKR